MERFISTTTAQNIRDLQDQIVSVAMKYGIDTQCQYRVRLVLDELLTNIRLHAYKETLGDVAIELSRPCGKNDSFLCLRIQDWGCRFNPLRQAPPPVLDLGIDDRPIGGLGLYMVLKQVCAVHYTYLAAETTQTGSNQLTLCMRLTR